MSTRPERRKSSLAGSSPLTPPPAAVPAAEVSAAPYVAPVVDVAQQLTAAPIQNGGEAAPKPKRTKMNYYASTDQDGRIRAAYYAGRDRYGWRSMTDMQLAAVMDRVVELEREFNGGQEFEPMPPGTGPVGRPLE